MTEGTIEERIVELQSKKNSLIAGAMGGASKGALQVNTKKSRTPNIVLQWMCDVCTTAHVPQHHMYLNIRCTSSAHAPPPLTVCLDLLANVFGADSWNVLGDDDVCSLADSTPLADLKFVCLCVGCRSRELAICGCSSLESADAFTFDSSQAGARASF